MNKAIFIDKDGTLITDVPYNVDPDRISLERNSTEGLRALQESGYLLIVISNQSGVAKGMFEEACLKEVEHTIDRKLASEGIHLAGFYYCPHHPEGTVPSYQMACDCRKPQPGMILRAARHHNIDLTVSWMIGDILNDVEAGNRAGCRTVLIDNGNETEWIMTAHRRPTFTVKTINEAADLIVHETLVRAS